jgi:5-methylthioadenosine/S-adenosylhomocysteine deaminase
MLESRGLLGPNLLAAHCVRVDADEIGLLAQRGTGVAHCPRSNGILGCGVAPLRELLDAGTRVGSAPTAPRRHPRSTRSRS